MQVGLVQRQDTLKVMMSKDGSSRKKLNSKGGHHSNSVAEPEEIPLVLTPKKKIVHQDPLDDKAITMLRWRISKISENKLLNEKEQAQ